MKKHFSLLLNLAFINKRKIEDRNKTVILNSNSNGVENFNCIRNKREIKDNLAAEDEMKDFCKKKISKKESKIKF